MAPTRQKNAPPPPVAGANGHDAAADDAEIIVDEPDAGADADAALEEVTRPAASDPGVDSLKEQLAAAERRAQEAEAAVARERSERGKDQQTIVDSRLLVIDSTIQTNEAKKADIMRRMKDAKEAGDYDAETTASAELAEVTIDLKQAKLGKERLEEQIEEAKTRPANTSTGDQMEDWLAAQTSMGEASKKWLREHRDYMEDPEKNAMLTLAHTRALKSGNKVNTSGYFEAIEKELGMTDDPDRDEPSERRQSAAPAAPVGRGGQMEQRKASPIPGITILGPNKYRVSSEIREAAEMSGVSVKQYVEEALKLQRGSDGQLH